MATIVEKKQGDDIKVTIRITDDAGAYINIDNLDELYVYIVHKASKITLAQFSKAGAGSFTALIKDNTTTYHGWVDSSDTDDAQTGIYIADVNVVETEAELGDTIQNSIEIEDIFNLVFSTSKASS